MGEPRILDRTARREVIEGLELAPFDPQQAMHLVVEAAADAGAADAVGLGFEVEDLPQRSRLPE